MKFSHEWIKELSGVSLSAQEAADVITAKSFEVEEVLDSAGQKVMDIKVMANRPDCLSHLGIARELCALTNTRFAAPTYEYKIDEHPKFKVSIKDAKACPRYSGLIVRDIKVGPSPAWLRERLEACGLKSISNVVDVTNYVMLELGQPMHAFDLKLLDEVVVRRAKKGETLTALDEARTEYELDESMLVIADSQKPLAIAGIKGGANSGISDDTDSVLLEAANFDPETIRATSRQIGLKTDASVRFSFGMDPNITTAALMRAAELLVKVAGATPDKEIIDVYPVAKKESEILLDLAYTRSLLGVDIGDGQIRGILNSLGFETVDEDGALKVTVPTRRLDVSSPEDLIEEVGRVYGYDAIPALAPTLPIFDEHSWVKQEDTQYPWDEAEYIKERMNIVHILSGMGYSEVYNYAFLSDELKNILKIDELAELAQPLSSDYRWLRKSLVPRLLVNVCDNMRFTDDIRIFENGHVYDHFDQGKESARLGMAISKKVPSSELFFEIKGSIDLVLERIGIADYFYDDAEDSFSKWERGAVNAANKSQRALIRLEGGQVIGFVATVSTRVASAMKIKGAAAFAELDLRALISHAQDEREFEPLPKYPSVVRDIAIMVNVDTKIDSILQVIQAADDSGIIRDVDVFDIFVPTGKEKIKAEGDTPDYGKSVAFHIIYRADDHTLTDGEVSKVEDSIKRSLEEKLAAQIR